jgi:two-component system, NtrC family, sensor histidine kinase PilS
VTAAAPSPTLSSAPAVAPIPSASDRDRESGPIQPPRQPTEDYRTVVYLMLFRVVLASVLLLCTVSLAVTHGTSDSLGRVFARFLFGLLALAYAATVVYAILLPRIEHLVGFAYLQIGVDLLLIAVLVHATGGAQSAFTILFMIQVIAVALLPERYGAAYVAIASALLVVAVTVAGYLRLLPTVPGQSVFPWEMSTSDLFFRLVLNVAAIATMGALGLNLSGQTQRAGERLARHQQYAGDLALLHQNTIRCLSSGLVTVTLDGLITSINGAACEILGITQATALGNPLARRIPGLSLVLEVAGPVGSVRRHEIDAIRPDGSVRNLGISATPLSDHAGQVIGRVIHFQDLTELRRMQIEVERSERLASIGRLASGIAHEIRNPLASISGSVEMLRRSPGADGESRQLVDIAVREVDRLNRLITDLLEYARPRPEEKQPLDLAEIAGEIAKAFEHEKRSTETRVVVELEPSAGIEGAAGQMRQVIWNLLRNAVEAMPEGGTIRIRVARAELPGRKSATVLSVSDTGVGISQEDQDQIFEPFFSKKRGGTGLGLPTVARIVEDHKGHIEVTSAPGRGTEFSLRFPYVYVPGGAIGANTSANTPGNPPASATSR